MIKTETANGSLKTGSLCTPQHHKNDNKEGQKKKTLKNIKTKKKEKGEKKKRPPKK